MSYLEFFTYERLLHHNKAIPAGVRVAEQEGELCAGPEHGCWSRWPGFTCWLPCYQPCGRSVSLATQTSVFFSWDRSLWPALTSFASKWWWKCPISLKGCSTVRWRPQELGILAFCGGEEAFSQVHDKCKQTTSFASAATRAYYVIIYHRDKQLNCSKVNP